MSLSYPVFVVRHVPTIDIKFKAVKTYDYHPPMRLPDPESPDRSLGDCVICMDAITLDQPTGEKGISTSKETPWASSGESHSVGILDVVHRNVVGAANARKSYSLAPCHHLFVSFYHCPGWPSTLTLCVPAYFLSRTGTLSHFRLSCPPYAHPRFCMTLVDEHQGESRYRGVSGKIC